MKKVETLTMQIHDHLKRGIENGEYSSRQRLPTERELSEQFFVSRITSKRALNLLSQEGLIVRIPGKGSFVKTGEAAPPLSTGGSQPLIALVMGGFTSSFGLDVLNGAMDTAHAMGAHLIVSATYNDQEREAQILRDLMHGGVSGVILQPVHADLYSKTILDAVYSGYPLIMLDRMMQGIGAPFVGVDNRLLSYEAVSRLLECGHEHIALLSVGDEQSSTIRERMDGFTDAFIDHKKPVNKDLWRVRLQGDLPQDTHADQLWAYEQYVALIARHLSAHPQITAVFGTEYCVAKAAWAAARRLGRRVPEDLSLVSFDMDSGYIGSHNMSHVRQPQREMGQRAVELLLGSIRSHETQPLRTLLAGEWVDGGSIAPPPSSPARQTP